MRTVNVLLFGAGPERRPFLLSLSAALAAVVLFAAAPPVKAQSDKLKEAREGVRATMESLDQTKNLSAEEELALRKEGLRKIFAFSSTEISDLRERLLEAQPLSADYLSLERFLAARLDEYLKHVAAQEKILKNLSAMDAVRFLAAQFDAWRTLEYQKTADLAVDFLFVVRGEALLTTADARFLKIANGAQKAGGGKISNWQPYLLNAARAIKEARDFHIAARAELLKRLAPQEPQEETRGAEKPADALEGAVAAESAAVPSIRDLVVSSVEKMKEAYRNFLAIARLLQN